MIFKNFEEFESILDELLDNEQYEVADGIMENQIDNICKLSSLEEIDQYLWFYASVAGDCESFGRFQKLCRQLVSLNKIKSSDLAKYEEKCPVNRWF